MSQESDDTVLLPLVRPGDHLAVEPSVLDFDEILQGESATLEMDLINITGHPVTVSPSVVAPLTLSSSDPFTLQPGGEARLEITASSNTAQLIDQELVLEVTHDQVGVPRKEIVPVIGKVVLPAQLRIDVPDFGLFGVTSFNFGYVPFFTYPRNGAPYFEVEITNIGDDELGATARSITIGGGIGGTQNDEGLGNCYWSNPVSEVCIARNGSNQFGSLKPGESLVTRWHLFPYDADWFGHSYLIDAENTASMSFELKGGFVPFSLPDGPFLAAQREGEAALRAEAALKNNDYEGLGRSTDPLGPDPLGAFIPEGYDPKALFSVGEVDTVDARSGNAVVSIPLGGPQSARAGLSYELQLVVNSRIWKRETQWGIPTDVYFPEDEDVVFVDPIHSRFDALTSEYPNPSYNVAPGVSLHMGRLWAPLHSDDQSDWYTWDTEEASVLDIEKVPNTGSRWVYADPSGAEHIFYLHMHGKEKREDGPATDYREAEVLYTRDQSYLRLRLETVTEGGVADRELAWLDFPSGETHLFEKQSSPHRTLGDRWLLQRIEDRFGNAVTITYGGTSWTIKTGTVTRTGGQSIGTVTHDGWRQTDVSFSVEGRPLFVRHKGYKGLEDNKRQYNFDYSQPFDMDRPIRSVFHSVLKNFNPAIDTTLEVMTLDGISVPDGTNWTLNWRLNEAGRELIFDGFDMPTGAKVRYQQANVWPSNRNCGNGGKVKPVLGVVRRWVTDGSDTVADRRFFRQFRTPPQIDSGVCPSYASDLSNVAPRAEHRVAIWEQQQGGLSTVSVQYFSDFPFALANGGWTHVERDVPFTRSTPDPESDDPGADRFLSRELYSCTYNVGSGPTIGYVEDSLDDPEVGDQIEDLIGASGCQLKQTTYAGFDVEREADCGEPSENCSVGFRKIDERVVYADDGDKWIRRHSSGFDGVGNYRTQKVYSNFRPTSNVHDLIQTSYRQFNPDLPKLELDDQHVVIGTYQEPSNWTFQDYGIFWVQGGGEDGLKRGGEAIFSDDGLLRLERTWRLGGAGNQDVVVKNAYEPTGELSAQRFFGADTYLCNGGVLAAFEWDDEVPPWNHVGWAGACAEYSVQHVYDKGVLAQQFVVGSTEYQVNREIDASTGWALLEILNSGERIDFNYDRVGRLTESIRKEAANHIYEFSRSGGRWISTLKTYPKGQTSGSTIRTHKTEFDGLGRVKKQEIPSYDGSTVTRKTAYHAGGAMSGFTTLESNTDWTTFDYDYRGRLVQRTHPDGSTVENKYWGDRQIRVRTKVATSTTGEANADTFLVHDGLGRLVEVTLPEGAVESFEYDPLGQMTSVTRGTQVKSYGVDGRGFRTYEEIPERKTYTGSSSSQLRSVYSQFTTRGLPQTLTEGARITSFAYDGLGRTTSVTVDGMLIKSIVYGTVADGAGHGQMVEATRENYRDSGSWTVKSTYGHDMAARINSRDLQVISRPNGQPIDVITFEQTWTSDDLGNVDYATYPVDIAPTGSTPKLPSRSLDPQFAYGHYMTKVVMPGVADMTGDFTYHKSGLVATVDHGGSAGTDTYTLDASGMPRWASVSLAGGLRDLGSFTYDSSSNVTGIGNDVFVYDGNSRLTSSSVVSAGNTHTIAYGYDIYDNLIGSSFGTVDARNNQLTGGVTAYDELGNLIQAPGGIQVDYDGLDKVAEISFASHTELSVYDHNDHRVLFDSQVGNVDVLPTWTFRDLEGRVIREASGYGSDLTWNKDTVYGGGRLISSIDSEGDKRHYHTDHLGTTRYISTEGKAGREVDYQPYGNPITANSGERAVGFAGHEVQDNGFTTYMRGRTYLHTLGRFAQVDPARASWNAYTYGHNNPVGYVDPTGEIAFGIVKKAVKLAFKGGDVAATFAGAIADLKTATDSNASTKDRLYAAASLASELALPVSARDVKAGSAVLGAVAGKISSGKVLRRGDLPEGGTPIYRGLGPDHHAFDDALEGVARPGDINGHADALRHNLGETRTSRLTSWTRDRAVAENISGPDGVILEWRTGPPPENSGWKFMFSEDVYREQEVLVEGTLRGARVTQP